MLNQKSVYKSTAYDQLITAPNFSDPWCIEEINGMMLANFVFTRI